MQRGINLGNALDALPGAVDALQIRDRHLDAIRAAGFDTVRLPVRWSAHTAPIEPFTVDPAFLDVVDQMVDRLLERGFDVVVNDHHDDELCADPASHTDRFLAMWAQIATRLAHHSPAVHVELLNEPRPPMTPLRWNRLLAAAFGVVRDVDHDRTVIIGPAAMNTIDALADLELPVDDRMILTIHYYEPLAFTHQGAPWWPGADEWLDTAWGSDTDRRAVDADLQRVAVWADERRLPVFISEFGTYRRAAMPARVSWTTVVRTTAERLGMSWCYWDFGTDFGAYDTITDTWRPELRAALLDG